jgi:hypothetical protein
MPYPQTLPNAFSLVWGALADALRNFGPPRILTRQRARRSAADLHEMAGARPVRRAAQSAQQRVRMALRKVSEGQCR